jgi:S-phase kinase-associated protein 1
MSIDNLLYNSFDSIESIEKDDKTFSGKINLISQEGHSFEISKSAAVMSKVLQVIIEGDNKETEIPLKEVSTDVMQKVVEFMIYHENVEMPEISKPIQHTNIKYLTTQWDANFINVENELLFKLLTVSNYLDMKPLLNLCCAKIATMIKGKTREQIKTIFHN